MFGYFSNRTPFIRQHQPLHNYQLAKRKGYLPMLMRSLMPICHGLAILLPLSWWIEEYKPAHYQPGSVLLKLRQARGINSCLKLLPTVTFILLFISLTNLLGWSQKPTAVPAKATISPELNRGKGKNSNSIPLELLTPTQQLALGRLQAIGEQAKTLDGSILQVRVMAKVADALWEYDEPFSRRLFMEAYQAVDGVKLDFKKDRRVLSAEKHGWPGPLQHLRSEVLQLIAPRDLKLAQKLRTLTEKKEKAEKTDEGSNLNRETKAETSLDLALALAKTQPEQTAQLFLAQLESGVSELWTGKLIVLRATQPDLANTMFANALTQTRTGLPEPHTLVNLAYYVLPTEEDELLSRNPLNDASRRPTIQIFLDFVQESLQGQLADGGVSLAKENTRWLQDEYRILQSLLPFFRQLQPAKMAFIQQSMGALLGLMSPEQGSAEANPRQDSVEDLLYQAERTVGERSQTIAFIRASGRALAQGNLSQALDIASRISDLHEREIQTSIILFQKALKEINQGQLDEALRYARDIQFVPQRVRIFDKVARKLWEQKERERARATVEEVWAWLAKRSNNAQKVDVMLNLTATMALYDATRGLEFLQDTLKALSRTEFSLIAPEPKQVSVEVQITPDLLDFESSIAPLARKNYERVFLMSQAILPKDAALLAQSIACQQALRGGSETSKAKKP